MGKKRSAPASRKTSFGILRKSKRKLVQGESSNVHFITPQMAEDIMEAQYDLSEVSEVSWKGKKVAVAEDSSEESGDCRDGGEESGGVNDNSEDDWRDPNWFDDIEFDSDGERLVDGKRGRKTGKEGTEGSMVVDGNDLHNLDSDDEVHEVGYDTSDDNGEYNIRRKGKIWEIDSDIKNIKLGLYSTFRNTEVFRKVFKFYALKTGFDYDYRRNQRTEISVKCLGENCRFWCWASDVGQNEIVQIRVWRNEHSCGRPTDFKKMTLTFIATSC